MKPVFRIVLSVMMAIGAIVGSAAESPEWAQVRLSVSQQRGEPRESAEIVSQAIMGTPVQVVEKKGSWWMVETPDGYHGWMDALSLEAKTDEQMQAWRSAPRLVATYPYQAVAYAEPDATSPRRVVTDIVPGDIFEGSLDKVQNGRVQITTPDGRTAWADAAVFTPIEVWAAQDFDSDVILDHAFAAMGAPYLWGGLTVKGTDCSGLVRQAYFSNGYILRRDASQQCKTGKQLDPTDQDSFQPADLLFFGNKSTGRISHVGLYDSNHHMIHSSGRVRYNSIDPSLPNYYDREILKAVRIAGSEGTDGITQARNHPWYF